MLLFTFDSVYFDSAIVYVRLSVLDSAIVYAWLSVLDSAIFYVWLSALDGAICICLIQCTWQCNMYTFDSVYLTVLLFTFDSVYFDSAIVHVCFSVLDSTIV